MLGPEPPDKTTGEVRATQAARHETPACAGGPGESVLTMFFCLFVWGQVGNVRGS